MTPQTLGHFLLLVRSDPPRPGEMPLYPMTGSCQRCRCTIVLYVSPPFPFFFPSFSYYTPPPFCPPLATPVFSLFPHLDLGLQTIRTPFFPPFSLSFQFILLLSSRARGQVGHGFRVLSPPFFLCFFGRFPSCRVRL